MPKWIMILMMTVAIGCARNSAHAKQPEPQPEPAQPRAQEEAERAEAERAAQDAGRVRGRALADAERARTEAALAREGALMRAQARVASRVKKEPAAWLGVSTDRVPPSLRQHLELKHKGIGLIIERVEPTSPAAEAGLQQYDIIEKLDDQWLVNSEQFGVLIRMHKSGDDVNLSIIRKGQPQQITAKLVEKELPVLDQFGAANWVGVPEGAFELTVPRFDMQPLLQLEQLHNNHAATVVIQDGEHTLQITTKDGQKHLQASDAAGVVIFEGPIETEEQRAAIPEDIEKKLEKFDYVGGVVNIRKAPKAEKSTERD